jgi:hypothetical protein
MKNVAIIAVLLGVLGNAANAESAIAITEASNFTMAMNNTAGHWIEQAPTATKNANREIEVEAVSKAMEEVSLKLDKQLEDKMTQELDYAMH